jgi:hypothetical protein
MGALAAGSAEVSVVSMVFIVGSVAGFIFL